MNETEVEKGLRDDPDIAFGLAVPYESSPDVEYVELFAMGWSVIAPRGHASASRRRLTLQSLAAEPLILYERGSTGRQHVLEALSRPFVRRRSEIRRECSGGDGSNRSMIWPA